MDLMKLVDVRVGQTGTIKKVDGEGKVRRRLFDMGVTPNANFFVRKKAPLGDPIELTIRGYELSLRKDEAALVLVTVDEEDNK